MRERGRVLAYLGKGGAGKTVLAALTGRLVQREGGRLLLIDADPAGGLTAALGEDSVRTVGAVREEVIRRARQEEGAAQIALTVDYLLLETLVEREEFSLLAMGRTEGPGCFCPVNTLLRESVEALAGEFDYVVIDAEAGLEQVSRQVTREVDWPLIVSDSSVRAVQTALSIHPLLADSGQKEAAGVIFNRTEAVDPTLAEMIRGGGMKILGCVPFDPGVAAFDQSGQPLWELSPDSPALQALHHILLNAGVLAGGGREGG